MWIKESVAFVVLRKLLFVRLIVRIGAWEPEKSGIFKNLKGMVDIMDLNDFSCMVLCVYMWFSFPLHVYFSFLYQMVSLLFWTEFTLYMFFCLKVFVFSVIWLFFSPSLFLLFLYHVVFLLSI